LGWWEFRYWVVLVIPPRAGSGSDVYSHWPDRCKMIANVKKEIKQNKTKQNKTKQNKTKHTKLRVNKIIAKCSLQDQ